MQFHVNNINRCIIFFALYFNLASIMTAKKYQIIFLSKFHNFTLYFNTNFSLIEQNIHDLYFHFTYLIFKPNINLNRFLSLYPNIGTFSTSKIIYFFILINSKMFWTDSRRFQYMLYLWFLTTEYRFTSSINTKIYIIFIRMNTFYYF